MPLGWEFGTWISANPWAPEATPPNMGKRGRQAHQKISPLLGIPGGYPKPSLPHPQGRMSDSRASLSTKE